MPLGLLTLVGLPSGLGKNQGTLQVQDLGVGGVGAEWFFSPLPPLQHHFSWQNYHPLFLLAALLQAVCVKNYHFFCQAVLTGIWSLNSNCSLIAFLSTIQNLPGLFVYFGISRDINQYVFIFTEIMTCLKKSSLGPCVKCMTVVGLRVLLSVITV